jgi:hypothetical protein
VTPPALTVILRDAAARVNAVKGDAAPAATGLTSTSGSAKISEVLIYQ